MESCSHSLTSSRDLYNYVEVLGEVDLTNIHQQRKDIMNDHQGKALEEGCHEREWARTSGSSREKTNTKRNSARVTTKSKSRMQTVTNGHVGQKDNESCCWRVFQHWRPRRVS